MEQAAQIVGAVLILVPFAAAQASRLATDSMLYLLLNLAGGLVLLVVAAAGRDWGFLLLEIAWVAVSLSGLVKVVQRTRLS